MSNEKNTPPLLLIILFIVAVFVLAVYASKFRDAPVPVSEKVSETTEGKVKGAVQWRKPLRIQNIDVFDLKESGLTETYSTYETVGTVTSGIYAGGDVILYTFDARDADGPAFSDSYYRFVRKDGKWFLVVSNSDGYNPDAAYTKFKADTTFSLDDLEMPEFIVGPRGETLKYEPYAESVFPTTTEQIVKSFTDPKYGDVYTSKAGLNEGVYGMFANYGFYIKKPDGTAGVFSLVVPFMAENKIPAIVWNDGTKNRLEFGYTDRTGCGSSNFASVVTDVKESDLFVSGKTDKGENVYEFKNTQHPLLKGQYENRFQYVLGGADGTQTTRTYAEFVSLLKKDHLIFFWRDSFGRLIKFENSAYGPIAECGKPVIYLYPEKTTSVHVTVEPRDGFSITEPTYNNGWDVVAAPTGELTEVATGKKYPYLFWEGRGGIYETPKKGFVVEQKNVHEFLVEKLAKLGLNNQETKDFIEFWEPRMKSSPYYFVTFIGNAGMDKIAPLTITPKPDQVIRVLMDFTPLDKPIDVEGFTITTPERKGFTVVEWGGVLR